MTEVIYPAYCPNHLGIHDHPGCATGGHISLADYDDPYAEALRRGYTFYCGDVTNLRDSADAPRVGDVVGDKRVTVMRRYFHPAYLREVVDLTEDHVVWKRPNSKVTYRCLKVTWYLWARGGWRCDPDGRPTRKSFFQRGG